MRSSLACRPCLSLIASLAASQASSSDRQSAPQLITVLEHISAPSGTPIPRLSVDPSWPHMPETLLWGEVSGVAVDADDSVWLVHRPDSLTPTDNGLAQTPPVALCCEPAPAVAHFASNGTFLGGFGGPETAPEIDGVNQWPTSLHGIFVDADRTLWFAGIGRDDHVVVNYSREGRYIGQIGRRGQTRGNANGSTLGNPSDVYRDGETVLIADGYINRRFLGFNRTSGSSLWIWGAYGAPPSQETRQGAFDQSQATSTGPSTPNPHAEAFGGIIHYITPTGDGQAYVCDRQNNRAQLFNIAANGAATFVQDAPKSITLVRFEGPPRRPDWTNLRRGGISPGSAARACAFGTSEHFDDDRRSLPSRLPVRPRLRLRCGDPAGWSAARRRCGLLVQGRLHRRSAPGRRRRPDRAARRQPHTTGSCALLHSSQA